MLGNLARRLNHILRQVFGPRQRCGMSRLDHLRIGHHKRPQLRPLFSHLLQHVRQNPFADHNRISAFRRRRNTDFKLFYFMKHCIVKNSTLVKNPVIIIKSPAFTIRLPFWGKTQ
jgi:hypothetical protein